MVSGVLRIGNVITYNGHHVSFVTVGRAVVVPGPVTSIQVDILSTVPTTVA